MIVIVFLAINSQTINAEFTGACHGEKSIHPLDSDLVALNACDLSLALENRDLEVNVP